MKFGIAIGKTLSPTVPLVLGGDYVESLETAARLGFQAVEIHLPDPDALPDDRLVKACHRLGMEISTLGTGSMYGLEGLSLIDDSSEKIATIQQRLRRFVDHAAILGSRVTIGSIKGNIPKGQDRAPYFDRLAVNLKVITDYAAEKGVLILLEATNRYENNLLNTGKDVHDFIVSHQLPNCRILMDTYHINIEEDSIDGCLTDTGDLLGYIHFAENTRRYPGSGCFQFGNFRQAIQAYGYDGVVSAECFPWPDSETAAARTIDFFHRLFA